MAEYLSYSSLTNYEDCQYSYYLKKIQKAWQRPAVWFPQGTAFHKAAEEIERSGRELTLEKAQEAYAEEYASEMNRYLKTTPNTSYWMSSGPYRGEPYTDRNGKHYPADWQRRYDLGKGQVARYHEYVTGEEGRQDVIWISDDGEPGIELGLEYDLEGVTVRGYVDQVLANGDEMHVRDLKSGNEPGSAFQLKVYAVGLEETYGGYAPTGDFWMAPNKKRRGGPTDSYDLSAVSRQEVVDRFHAGYEGIKAEEFDPKPGPQCLRCSVNTSCPFADLG